MLELARLKAYAKALGKEPQLAREILAGAWDDVLRQDLNPVLK